MGTNAAETPRWTEIEHLTDWDEEFYDIYTAKKLGKWVMIKTLKPQFADDPKYKEMIEREFDVRYNLAHPNIVMINDFEDIPGIGRSIVTDDVYGDTLRKLLNEGKVTEHHLDQVCLQLINALEYIQTNHIVHPPLRPENIIFTQNIGNLKLIDVGFEQKPSLKTRDVADDIFYYGQILELVLAATGTSDLTLQRVARKCTDPDPRRRYRDIQELRMAIQNRKNRRLMMLIIIFLGLLVLLLGWLSSPYRPAPPLDIN
ncbi:MAG: protein kinase [Muribaculaceae bacterium]|nr:protein kinase [Muribaculaceae bacterium]